MLNDLFEEWEPEKILKVFPPLVGILFIFVISVLFPGNPGMLGISILFVIIFSVIPYIIYNYIQVRRIKAMEEQLPNFLRDLVENKKSGMTLPEALKSTTKNEYGKLNPEVEKMSKQISWNISFDKVLTKFANRMERSDLIQRSVRIIMEARRSGGNVVSVMETIASDASTLIEMERQRKSSMSQHAVVMYLIYFMYLAITVILSKILVPMTETGGAAAGGTEIMGFGGGGQVCGPGVSGGAQGVICSLFGSLSETFGLGTGMEGYYKGLFLSMILVQGMFTGLIIGQIRNNSASTGIKHSLILTGIGFTAFILILKYFTFEFI